MKLNTTSSGFIKGVEYIPLVGNWKKLCPRSGFLLVAIRNGGTYAYLVPSWMAGLIMIAYHRGASIGHLFNTHIKGKYPQTRVDNAA